MKYKFVYDESFLAENQLELSPREMRAVIATIVGKHNAIFYGYKPERITKAIKKLLDASTPVQCPAHDVDMEHFMGGGRDLSKGAVSLADGGVLFMEDMDKYRTSVIQMLAVPMKTGSVTLSRAGESMMYPAEFRLVATMDHCPTEGKYHHVIEECGIVFKCSSPDTIENVFVEKAKKAVFDAYTSSQSRAIYVDNSIVDFDNINFTTEAEVLFRDDILNQPPYNYSWLNIARVARTVADINGHSLVRMMDVRRAQDMYNLCVPHTEENNLSEEDE